MDKQQIEDVVTLIIALLPFLFMLWVLKWAGVLFGIFEPKPKPKPKAEPVDPWKGDLEFRRCPNCDFYDYLPKEDWALCKTCRENPKMGQGMKKEKAKWVLQSEKITK